MVSEPYTMACRLSDEGRVEHLLTPSREVACIVARHRTI